MKLDFIDHINEHGDNLVRLYDFNREQAEQLLNAIKEVVIAKSEALDINSLQFVKARNCYLTLRIAERDEGIASLDKVHFNCYLTLDGYRRMAKLLEPFANKETQGYQWL